jgi:hypothetical protein
LREVLLLPHFENILPETTIDYKKNGYQKCRHLTGIHQGIGPKKIRGKKKLNHMQ